MAPTESEASYYSGTDITTTESKPPFMSRFREFLSPTLSLLAHPLSAPRPGASGDDSPERRSTLSSSTDEYHLSRQVSYYASSAHLPQASRSLARGCSSSFFGSQEKPELYEIQHFRAAISGYFTTSCSATGDEFYGAATSSPDAENEISLAYETLWLDFQFFWDMLLRHLPNTMVSDQQQLGDVVDLLADVQVGRLAAAAAIGEHDCTPAETSRHHIHLLRRRLQHFQLTLQTELSSCAKSPKLLCGCSLGLKRVEDKSRLWAPLFPPSSSTAPDVLTAADIPRVDRPSGDRNFSMRDVACLLRLEDYLTFVSREFERVMNHDVEEATLTSTVQNMMTIDLQTCLGPVVKKTVRDLKARWMQALCQPRFRHLLVAEVQAIATDAIHFKSRFGPSRHREQCELWAPSKPSFVRQISVRSKKD